MTNIKEKINYDEVSEQIEQSFQMLHNALFTRQNQLLSQLSDLAIDENDENDENGIIRERKVDMINEGPVQLINNQLKYFGIKMDSVLREIREFGTISMTSVDPNLSTISDLAIINKFPINEETQLSIILRNGSGELVKDRGILDPNIHMEMKNIGRPHCEILESNIPHLVDLSIKLPQAGEYDLSIKFCESSILGSPFTVIGSLVTATIPVVVIKPSEPTNLDYLYKIGSKGIKPSDFGNPQSIITSGIRILVTDSGNSCIQVFNENGDYVTCFGPKEKKNGRLLRPVDIVETPNGHYLVTDYELRVILVYDLLGNYVSSFGQKLLVGPKGICVDKSGQIIVADNKDSSLVFFKATGKFIKKIKDKPKSENKLAGPHFLAILSSGDIVVTDFYNHCVKVFDRNGIYLNEFGKHGDSWGEFNYPTGICCSDTDDVIVSDWGNSRIVIFNDQFVCTRIFKCKEEPLCGPQGLTLNRDGTQILIVDSGNHCFKAFQFK